MEKKLFEISANGHSYGLYEGKDKLDAMLAQTVDAGYRDFEGAADVFHQSVDEYLTDLKAEEIVIKNFRVNDWEGEKLAVYFTVEQDDENTDTLEWITDDGDLEEADSHIDCIDNFSEYLRGFVRGELKKFIEIEGERKKITELLAWLEENKVDEDEDEDENEDA
ncbi:hypothetical protein E0J16_00045 [Rhizobium pisi]|uniref:hypothetical protein n=1 Tax=Rhizobium pisi TaxID=574561 RepID=UPI00103F0366|nr:hypothetical protein [Rhizobium pisi]TCA62713.1 hypothetical protein E0J16_00045 [Rhizobium pisi]